MKKNSNNSIFSLEWLCPRCQQDKIRAISIRDCYYERPFCPNCGTIKKLSQKVVPNSSGKSLLVITAIYEDGKIYNSETEVNTK